MMSLAILLIIIIQFYHIPTSEVVAAKPRVGKDDNQETEDWHLNCGVNCHHVILVLHNYGYSRKWLLTEYNLIFFLWRIIDL